MTWFAGVAMLVRTMGCLVTEKAIGADSSNRTETDYTSVLSGVPVLSQGATREVCTNVCSNSPASSGFEEASLNKNTLSSVSKIKRVRA